MDKYALIQIVMTFIAGAGIFGFLVFVTRMIHFKIKKFDISDVHKAKRIGIFPTLKEECISCFIC